MVERAGVCRDAADLISEELGIFDKVLMDCCRPLN
jgi:hypothetical protein